MSNLPAPKIVDIYLELTKIGQTPAFNSPRSPSISDMSGGIAYGDAIFYDSIEAGYYGEFGFVAYRVKRDGTCCAFQKENVQQNLFVLNPGYNNRQIGAATFITQGTSGTIQSFTIPDVFSPGGYFFVPNDTFNPPSPCGSGNLTNTYYDAQNNLVAYEFINAFPDDSFIYAAIYEFGAYSRDLLNGGFIGVFPSNVDGFNLSTLDLPDNVNANVSNGPGSLRYQGGSLGYATTNSSEFNVGATKISIVQGGAPLNCADSNSQTYVTTTSAYNFLINESSPGFDFGVWNNRTVNGYCENTEIFITDAYYGKFGMFCKDFLAQVYIVGGIGLGCIVLFKDGTVLALAGNSETDGRWSDPIDIYTGFIDFQKYGLLPVAQVNYTPHPLINFCRPVSINGSFIT
jgi:hypothetical protein